MKKNKKWIVNLISLVFLSLTILGIINYIIDPLWTFNHKNSLNQYQDGFNERQQKTNYVYFRGLNNKNGLLLGSSRSTFINQNDFKDMNVFNYAVNSMYPYEYENYVNFAKDIKKQDFEYIIIGIDFFTSNTPKSLEFENPNYYINKTKSFLYRYKMLISADILKYSKRVIKKDYIKNKIYYNRNNIKFQDKLNEEDRRKRYMMSLDHHRISLNSNNYEYNINYKMTLLNLKKENPHSKFIVFIPPISVDLLATLLKENNHFENYKKWIKETIDVFGEVINFSTVNNITVNLENYPDDDHFYPYIGKIIANKISKKNDYPIDNFGIKLNKINIDDYLFDLYKKVDNYNVRLY